MPGCEWVEHRNTRVLVVTYGGCLTDQAMLAVLAQQVDLVKAEGSKVRVVHDYTGAHLGEGFLRESHRLSKERRQEAFEKVAMVGLGGIQKALLAAYRLATGDTKSRNFPTRAEALDWVVVP